MEAICMTGMLLYLSAEDIKRKTIPVIPMMGCGIFAIVLHLISGKNDILNMAVGMIPGVIAYVLSVLTKEKIGKGDAVLLMVTGLYMGFWGNVFMLWIGLIFAAVGGIIAIAMFKRKRGDELPFVPFLFAGYLVISVCNIVAPA